MELINITCQEYSNDSRVSDSTEKTFPGLGLGLYISNEIIKRYGEHIVVTSEKGKGSEFSFKVPYKSSTV